MWKKQQEEEIAIRRQMTDDPEQCMDLLMKWRGMKYTDHPPVSVEPLALADRQGLMVKRQCIREDAYVFGQIYFVETYAEMYDVNEGKTVTMIMDECCLVFNMKITSKVSEEYHTACFLNREDSNITF